jgi:hypothetical protein
MKRNATQEGAEGKNQKAKIEGTVCGAHPYSAPGPQFVGCAPHTTEPGSSNSWIPGLTLLARNDESRMRAQRKETLDA